MPKKGKYSANFFKCLLANHVRPYSKILKDGNLLDKGYFDCFLDFLTNASLLSNCLKIAEFG